jgi:hypothetical protein
MNTEESKLSFCHYLRGKNAFGTLEGGDHPFIPLDPATSSYWCIVTSGPIGPDGQPVEWHKCCNGNRNCFKEKKKTNEAS